MIKNCLFVNYKIMTFEVKIIEFLQRGLSGFWLTFFSLLTILGEITGFIITFAIIFIKNKKLSYFFAIFFIISQFFNKFLKIIIARERPFVNNESIINFANESGYSMPSGHSLNISFFVSFLFYEYVLRGDKDKIKNISISIFLATLLFGVTLSRMVLGVHYLTDIILGVFIGIMFAFISILLYNSDIKNTRRKKDERNTYS